MAKLTVKQDNRARMGYVPKAEIQDRINEGKLDQYDYVFTTDTQELVIISPTLEIVPVKSRIDVYPSESDANYQINHKTDTYAGQIVMIPSEVEEDGLKPWVVNEDVSKHFYVIPASAGHSQAIIDYNLAVNTPITNINSSTEVLLSDLQDGQYSVTGMYRICDGDHTHRIASSPILYAIKYDSANGDIDITELGASRIVLYTVRNDQLLTDRYVLESELDSKIDTAFDEKFDVKFEEKVDEDQATTEDIQDLFD